MSSSGESSAEVQKEAEAERAELVNTLDQLRENLKPANVIDEVLASAKITTGDISDKVWQTARDNPIPATFIALGAAMLLGVGSRLRSSAFSSTDTNSAVRSSAPTQTGWADQAGTSSVRSAKPPTASSERGAGQIGARLQSVGTRAAASASQIASSVRSLRREAAPRSAASSSTRIIDKYPSGVADMSYPSRSRTMLPGSLSRLLDEQPLVLAAVGVAIGAALGAAIPSTEAEGRLMGDASVSLKSRAQGLAQSELTHLKDTASATFDQLKQSAADHGVSKDNLAGLVQETGATVRGAVTDVADHAANTAGLKT